MIDDRDKPRESRDDRPPPLDYFAAHAPDAIDGPPSRPGLTVGWITLALGWVPFICGLVNSQATVRSGVRQIIAAHENAAILFSGLGLLAMLASLLLFVRARDGPGFLAAIISLVIASGMAACLVFPFIKAR